MPAKTVQRLQLWMSTAVLMLVDRLAGPAPESAPDDDRGDVPGWVMITVMTAIVVIALLTVFRNQVTAAVTNAFESVSGAGKA